MRLVAVALTLAFVLVLVPAPASAHHYTFAEQRGIAGSAYGDFQWCLTKVAGVCVLEQSGKADFQVSWQARYQYLCSGRAYSEWSVAFGGAGEGVSVTEGGGEGTEEGTLTINTQGTVTFTVNGQPYVGQYSISPPPADANPDDGMPTYFPGMDFTFSLEAENPNGLGTFSFSGLGGGDGHSFKPAQLECEGLGTLPCEGTGCLPCDSVDDCLPFGLPCTTAASCVDYVCAMVPGDCTPPCSGAAACLDYLCDRLVVSSCDPPCSGANCVGYVCNEVLGPGGCNIGGECTGGAAALLVCLREVIPADALTTLIALIIAFLPENECIPDLPNCIS